MKKQYVVIDKAGIHARPAAKLVQEANKISGDVNITYNGRTVNAKSIMGVMSLGIPCGATFEIEVVGDGIEQLEQVLKENGLI